MPLLKKHIRLGHAGIMDHSVDLSIPDFKKVSKRNGQKQQIFFNCYINAYQQIPVPYGSLGKQNKAMYIAHELQLWKWWRGVNTHTCRHIYANKTQQWQHHRKVMLQNKKKKKISMLYRSTTCCSSISTNVILLFSWYYVQCMTYLRLVFAACGADLWYSWPHLRVWRWGWVFEWWWWWVRVWRYVQLNHNISCLFFYKHVTGVWISLRWLFVFFPVFYLLHNMQNSWVSYTCLYWW